MPLISPLMPVPQHIISSKNKKRIILTVKLCMQEGVYLHVYVCAQPRLVLENCC